MKPPGQLLYVNKNVKNGKKIQDMHTKQFSFPILKSIKMGIEKSAQLCDQNTDVFYDKADFLQF
jgi:hypothetical protein